MSQIDKRIKVNTIIESQLPNFLVSDFPNATEFLKQYYISQEFQGGPSDLISNLDQYIKSDNLVPEVVTGSTTLSSNIDSDDTIISVPSTKGFPSEYGLLKLMMRLFHIQESHQLHLQDVFVVLVEYLDIMLVYHLLYLK